MYAKGSPISIQIHTPMWQWRGNWSLDPASYPKSERSKCAPASFQSLRRASLESRRERARKAWVLPSGSRSFGSSVIQATEGLVAWTLPPFSGIPKPRFFVGRQSVTFTKFWRVGTRDEGYVQTLNESKFPRPDACSTMSASEFGLLETPAKIHLGSLRPCEKYGCVLLVFCLLRGGGGTRFGCLGKQREATHVGGSTRVGVPRTWGQESFKRKPKGTRRSQNFQNKRRKSCRCGRSIKDRIVLK